MEAVLGIDFGTTNSVVATYINNKPVVVKNRFGNYLTPSIISFSKENELLVGEPAKRQAIINSEYTIQSIKRFMGEKRKFKLGNKYYLPHEIASFIIKELKNYASDFLGYEAKKAVITVPAYFNDKQRYVTKLAGKLAGLEVLRIINEPTAAALSYGIDKNFEGKVMVCDFGGGTFDVSILDCGEGVFEVIATSGNNFLGGDDFDFRIVNLLCDYFYDKFKINLRKDKMALQKIKEEAEKAKIALSEKDAVYIKIPFISADENGVKHLEYYLTIEEFNKITEELIEEAIKCIFRALEDAKLNSDHIDEIIFVGGSTKIKRFRERVYNIIKKLPDESVDPSLCVAMGAALEGNIITGESKDVVLIDVIPITLGVEAKGSRFVPIIKRNTPIPARESRLFTTISDNQSTVNINIYQGEHNECSFNTLIGNIQLTDIPPMPKGKPRIEVIFDIDVDGILHISAINKHTKTEQKIKIEYPFMSNI